MAVDVFITGHDVELSPRLKEYVEKKIGKLDRYMESIAEAQVELSYQKTARSAADRQVAQITLRGDRGLLLRTEDRTDDMFAAVDLAVEKLHRQIERYKGKHRRGRGNGASADTVALTPLEEETEAGPLRITRRKKFPLRPMDESEAIEEMEMLGQESFFVFYNARTETINVLYRRRDGAYGIIEPELG